MSKITKVDKGIGGEGCTQGCGTDPHHFDADPDPRFALMLIRIQIKVLLLIKVMQICNLGSTDPSRHQFEQGVTRKCRLSWLTTSALLRYMGPNAGGEGELRGLSQ